MVKKLLAAGIILALFITLFFYQKFAGRNSVPENKIPEPSIPVYPTVDLTSSQKKCGVCGPQGPHNINGSICSSDFVCKQGTRTTASYCVYPDESSEICEN